MHFGKIFRIKEIASFDLNVLMTFFNIFFFAIL